MARNHCCAETSAAASPLAWRLWAVPRGDPAEHAGEAKRHSSPRGGRAGSPVQGKPVAEDPTATSAESPWLSLRSRRPRLGRGSALLWLEGHAYRNLNSFTASIPCFPSPPVNRGRQWAQLGGSEMLLRGESQRHRLLGPSACHPSRRGSSSFLGLPRHSISRRLPRLSLLGICALTPGRVAPGLQQYRAG